MLYALCSLLCALCCTLQVEALPTFHYLNGRRIRLFHESKWQDAAVKASAKNSPNLYTVTVGGAELEVVLSSSNHAAVLEPSLNMKVEPALVPLRTPRLIMYTFYYNVYLL